MNIDFSQALERLQEMIDNLILGLPGLLVGMVVFGLFLVVAAILGRIVERLASFRQRRNLGKVVGRLAQWSVILLGLLVALVIIFPNFTPAQLIQLLGIGSIAIGFAFRDILENFLAGILLLITEPYRIGDQIVVQSFEGTVEDIHTRATTIRTYDGRRVVIPNAALFTDSVIVNTAFETRRIEHDFGIAYGADLERAQRVVLDTLRATPGVLAEPAPDVLITDLGDYAVMLRARWWIHPPRRVDALDSRSAVLAAIKTNLTSAGIDLPYPIQRVLLHDQSAAGISGL